MVGTHPVVEHEGQFFRVAHGFDDALAATHYGYLVLVLQGLQSAQREAEPVLDSVHFKAHRFAGIHLVQHGAFRLPPPA